MLTGPYRDALPHALVYDRRLNRLYVAVIGMEVPKGAPSGGARFAGVSACPGQAVGKLPLPLQGAPPASAV